MPSLWKNKRFWSKNDLKLKITTQRAYNLKHETDVLNCFLFRKAFLLPGKISKFSPEIMGKFDASYFLFLFGVCLLAQAKFSCINDFAEHVNVWYVKLTSKFINMDSKAKFPWGLDMFPSF